MTDTIRVDLSELKRFIDQTEGAEKVAEREAARTMDASLALFEEQVVSRTPVNVGMLRGSIATEFMRGTGLNMRGEVVTPIVYGEPVEYGRKAGKMPPVGPIYLWAYRKGIVTGPGPESRAIAWLIARAIGARGTKGAFMFRDGYAAAKPHVIAAWEGLLDRVVRELTK